MVTLVMVHLMRRVMKRIADLSPNTAFMGALPIVLVAWAGVCILSRQPGDSALIQFLLLALLMLVVTLVVLWRCQNTGFNLPFRWILFSAIFLRLMSMSGDPLFEDDYYRYLWDGYQTATTMDPYSHAPEKYFDEDVPEVFEAILSFINYPAIATVYGPVVQWIFALAYLMAPGEIWPLQLMSSLADVAVICLLSRLGAGNALLLYAWSPLILKEYSLTAHPDVFSITLMFVGIVAAFRKRALLAGSALGLALGAKVFALLIVPFLFSRAWAMGYWLRLGGATFVTLALITLSFGTVKIWVPEGLLAMADSWLFNSPLYYLLLQMFSFSSIKVILLASFVLYVSVVFLQRFSKTNSSKDRDDEEWHQWTKSLAAFRGDWLFALFLLCLPVINPWYVAWLLPFATLFPRWWSWTASYSILLSYWYGSNVGAIGSDSLQLPVSVLVLEFALVLLVPVTAWIVLKYLGVKDFLARAQGSGQSEKKY